MKHEPRLKKLEKSARPNPLETMPRPADVPWEIWRRAMELLADYSPEMLHPWTSLQYLADRWRASPATQVLYAPEPIGDVVLRAMAEAETGELWPDRITRTRTQLANLAETPEAELVEFLRAIDKIPQDVYGLPWPYSVVVLEQVGADNLLGRCKCLADKLQRGVITAEEHAAGLAELLPPITRADQENAMRTVLEQQLPDKEQGGAEQGAGSGAGAFGRAEAGTG